MRRVSIAWLILLAASCAASAQQNQCRTAPVGTSTAYCASEALVTETAAAGVAGPSSLKVHVSFQGTVAGCPAGICIQLGTSYNVGSVSRSAAGTYQVNFTTPFAASAYDCNFGYQQGNAIVGINYTTKSTGSIALTSFNTSFVNADANVIDVQCAGRQ